MIDKYVNAPLLYNIFIKGKPKLCAHTLLGVGKFKIDLINELLNKYQP